MTFIAVSENLHYGGDGYQMEWNEEQMAFPKGAGVLPSNGLMECVAWWGRIFTGGGGVLP